MISPTGKGNPPRLISSSKKCQQTDRDKKNYAWQPLATRHKMIGSIRARLHNGDNRSKLVRFKKLFFPF
jgi:hypothetical protein